MTAIESGTTVRRVETYIAKTTKNRPVILVLLLFQGCHIPPVTDKELIQRIKAHNSGDLINGLQGWKCKRCIRSGTPATPTPTPRVSMAPPLARNSLLRSLSVQSSSYSTTTYDRTSSVSSSRYPSSVSSLSVTPSLTVPNSRIPSTSRAESHDSHSTSRFLQPVTLARHTLSPGEEDADIMIIDDEADEKTPTLDNSAGLSELAKMNISPPPVPSSHHLKRIQSYQTLAHQSNIRTRTPDNRDATEELYRPRKKHASGSVSIVASTSVDPSPGTQARMRSESNLRLKEKESQKTHERTEQSPSITISREHKDVESTLSGALATDMTKTFPVLVSEAALPPPPDITSVHHSQPLVSQPPPVITTTSPARLRNQNTHDTRLMTCWIHEHAKNDRDPWEIALRKKSLPAPPSSTRRKSKAQKLTAPQSKLYYFSVSECVNGFKRG